MTDKKTDRPKGQRRGSLVWSPDHIQPADDADIHSSAEGTGSASPKNSLIPITVRLTEDQYRRLYDLKLSTPGKRRRVSSMQELFLEGISCLLQQKGLPPL